MCLSFVTKLKKRCGFLSSRIAPDDIFGSFFFKYYNEILCGG